MSKGVRALTPVLSLSLSVASFAAQTPMTLSCVDATEQRPGYEASARNGPGHSLSLVPN